MLAIENRGGCGRNGAGRAHGRARIARVMWAPVSPGGQELGCWFCGKNSLFSKILSVR